MATCFYQFFVF